MENCCDIQKTRWSVRFLLDAGREVVYILSSDIYNEGFIPVLLKAATWLSSIKLIIHGNSKSDQFLSVDGFDFQIRIISQNACDLKTDYHRVEEMLHI